MSRETPDNLVAADAATWPDDAITTGVVSGCITRAYGIWAVHDRRCESAS